MGGANGTQTIAVGFFQVVQGDDGVGTLQGEEVSDGRGFFRLPFLQVLFQRLPVGNLSDFTLHFHLAVPGQLRLGVCPGLLW